MKHPDVIMRFGACVVASLVLMLVPFPWICGWFIAATAHELGHYIALRACNVPVLGMRIGINGAVMDTGSMTPGVEILCTLFGPLCGVIPVLFWRSIPIAGFCALVQTGFNLLPIYPLDGGRILKTVLSLRLSSIACGIAMKWVRWIVLGLMMFLAIYCSAQMKSGFAFLLSVVVLGFYAAEK